MCEVAGLLLQLLLSSIQVGVVWVLATCTYVGPGSIYEIEELTLLVVWVGTWVCKEGWFWLFKSHTLDALCWGIWFPMDNDLVIKLGTIRG